MQVVCAKLSSWQETPFVLGQVAQTVAMEVKVHRIQTLSVPQTLLNFPQTLTRVGKAEKAVF